MSKQVVIVDYGAGNLLNVARAFEHIGASVKIVNTPESLQSVDRVVLPGVGAFRDGMNELKNREFVSAIKTYVSSERPLFGICLGMQMLMDKSEEFGPCGGLGIISGNVVAIPVVGTDGRPHKIPHIGWNELEVVNRSWDDSALQDTNLGSAVYFVHSYMAVPEDENVRLANCSYDGQMVCAAIQKDNVMGCQFHPEKSGDVGLHILTQFLEL